MALVDNKVIQVSFLTQDSGLGEAIARALGEEFATRTVSQFQFDQLASVRESSDVVLLDLRFANTQGDDETLLRLMDEISNVPSHPPLVVLCEEENRPLLLKAIEHGAHDSVTNPPNITDLRLILSRAYKFHAGESEEERLRAEERQQGRLPAMFRTSATMTRPLTVA